MPRINIEDTIYTDSRFFALVRLLGDEALAIGSLVLVWRMAQHYWTQTKNGIPIPVWERQRFKKEIIEVGLARLDGDFIWVCGSNESFAWLEENAKNGKIGGTRRAKNASRNHSGIFQANSSESRPLPLPLPQKDMCIQSANEESEKQNTHTEIQKQNPLPGEEKPPKITSDQINQLKDVWLETNKHYNQAFKTLPLQIDIEIARLVKLNGYEQTRLALLGARFEEQTENFDPAKNLSIRRFFKPNIFEKLMALGQRNNLDAKHDIIQQEPESVRSSPEEIAAFLGEVKTRLCNSQ